MRDGYSLLSDLCGLVFWGLAYLVYYAGIPLALAAAFLLGLLADWLCAQPAPNPLGVRPTAARIMLGKELFGEKLLSEDGTKSCASCHDASKGFTDGLPVAVGIRGLAGTINTPSVLNAAYDLMQFRNGRTFGTSTQALLPLENAREMGGRGNEAAAVARLQASSKYRQLFEAAFGQPPNAANLGIAIAAYETTLVTTDVLANRRIAGEKVLTPDAEIGFNIFVAANCQRCHSGPRFTDGSFHNTGLGHGRGDLGRQTVTRNRADARRWKTPSLIATTLTSPYMHDGATPTLRDVLHRYNVGNLAINGRVVTRAQYDQWKRDVAAGKSRDDVRRDNNSEIIPLDLAESQIDYLLRFVEESFTPMQMPQ